MMGRSKKWDFVVATVAAAFGLATIFSGGMALFGGKEAAAAVGDAVPLVLWFNFLAGFVYILGAGAIFMGVPWAKSIAWVIALSTLVVFAILIMLALVGTAFEWRTIGAMTLRSGFWLAIALAISKGAIGNRRAA